MNSLSDNRPDVWLINIHEFSWRNSETVLLSLTQFRSYIYSSRTFTNSGYNVLSPLRPEWQSTIESNKAIDTWKCLCLCMCALGQSNQRLLHWLPSRKNVGSMGTWEATHQVIKSNHAISCSELILGRWQTDKEMPFCLLPKNHSSKSVSHASVIICVHIIWKKSTKSRPWFFHMDLISDLIDDLINLIKSMPTLWMIKSCLYFRLYFQVSVMFNLTGLNYLRHFPSIVP